MFERLVFIPIAFKKGFFMSPNMDKNEEKNAEIYLKNAFVLLKSVQQFNKNVDVAVIVNFEIPLFYDQLFKNNNINIYKIDFEDYTMPADFTWSLAFFKIASLKYAVQNLQYEYFLQLDSDEICISQFDDMWNELNSKILTLYDSFRFGHPTRTLYSDLMSKIYSDYNKDVIEKTGAGFIAGNKKNLQHFIEICDEIYGYIKNNIESLEKNLGDELYTSIYCALFPERVSRANPYGEVYWTGKSYYYVSTRYKYNGVSIIHLPDEKKNGLLFVYDYILKKKKFPENLKLYRYLRFPKAKSYLSSERFFSRVKRKLLK